MTHSVFKFFLLLYEVVVDELLNSTTPATLLVWPNEEILLIGLTIFRTLFLLVPLYLVMAHIEKRGNLITSGKFIKLFILP